MSEANGRDGGCGVLVAVNVRCGEDVFIESLDDEPLCLEHYTALHEPQDCGV